MSTRGIFSTWAVIEYLHRNLCNGFFFSPENVFDFVSDFAFLKPISEKKKIILISFFVRKKNWKNETDIKRTNFLNFFFFFLRLKKDFKEKVMIAKKRRLISIQCLLKSQSWKFYCVLVKQNEYNRIILKDFEIINR